MSSCRNAPFVPWSLLFEDIFNYNLTLVKCEKAATQGQYRLYFHVEDYEDVFPKINNARFLKTLTNRDYSAMVGERFTGKEWN